MSDVIVIGGGASVRKVDLNKLSGFVIGVNDSSFHAPVNAAISMDRIFTEYRWEHLKALGEAGAQVWSRVSAMQNIKGDWPWLTRFACDYTSTVMVDKPATLNGTNSGMCGLNLAYRMRPKRVFLLGFDLCVDERGESYWYPPDPWGKPYRPIPRKHYAAWAKGYDGPAKQFKEAGIEVLNVSPSSLITAFRKITPKEAGCAV